MKQDKPSNPAVRESAEPTAGKVVAPGWLIVCFGALLLWAMLFLDNSAGGFNQKVYSPYQDLAQVDNDNPINPELAKQRMGKEVFDKTCTTCHQPTGLGKEGTAPPLVGSEWVLADNPDRIAHIVLNGLTGPVTVKGGQWNLTMPPWRDNFDDEHLAAVLSYVRNTWGNKAANVKTEALTAARKDTHPGPMTSPELMSMPDK